MKASRLTFAVLALLTAAIAMWLGLLLCSLWIKNGGIDPAFWGAASFAGIVSWWLAKK